MELRGISLTAAPVGWLASRARAAMPREACGLLIGRRAGDLAVVERVIEARNIAQGDERFEVDPLDHLRAQREAHAAGLEVIGAWHSHPQGPARPSPSDAREALPGWVHVVVDARSGDWLPWSLGSDGRVVELARRAEAGA